VNGNHHITYTCITAQTSNASHAGQLAMLQWVTKNANTTSSAHANQTSKHEISS